MNKNLIYNQLFGMLKTHVYVAFGATIMGMFILPVADNTFLKQLFSIVFILIYAVCIYSRALDCARQDKLYNKEKKPFLLKGMLLPAVIYIVWTALLILYKVTWMYNIISYNSGFINNLLFLFWNYPFSGFLNAVNGKLDILGIILFFAVSFITSTGGYIAGVKGFDISVRVSKIIYEEKDNDNGEVEK